MAILKFKNEYLDRINFSMILALYTYEDYKHLCPYGITIDYADGTVEQYQYYSTRPRNHDFTLLNQLAMKGNKQCSNKME